jgi:hypothetical protein
MNETRKNIKPGGIILMLIFVVIIPLLPLIISRRWDWWGPWIFAASRPSAGSEG